MNKYLLPLRRTLILFLTFLLIFSPAVFAAEKIVNDDCTINEAVFEQEWRKYSDFDERIPPESRSWDVQQYYEIEKKIDKLNYESFQLQAEMEFDRQMRLELRDVKKSLVNNLRNNLVKSFFRLSFLTADAIKTGVNTGQTYAKLFTAGALKNLPEGLSYLKDAMDVVTGLTPDHGDSELAKEVKNSAGDLDDMIKIVDNPKNIAGIAANRLKDKAEEKLGQLFPSVDEMKFSDEEVAILRNQNLKNRAIDDALMESYRINSERRNRVKDEIPLEIQRLKEEQSQFEDQEKLRVRDMLISECQQNKDDKENTEEETIETEGGETVVISGLSGHWTGHSKILQVLDPNLDQEERARAVGTTLPEEIYIEKTETGQFEAYSPDTGNSVVLNIEGRKISYYMEVTDPHDGTTYYEKMDSEIDKSGTLITGVAESGMPGTGPLYIYNISLRKQ